MDVGVIGQVASPSVQNAQIVGRCLPVPAPKAVQYLIDRLGGKQEKTNSFRGHPGLAQCYRR
jgi:hypothetical protein